MDIVRKVILWAMLGAVVLVGLFILLLIIPLPDPGEEAQDVQEASDVQEVTDDADEADATDVGTTNDTSTGEAVPEYKVEEASVNDDATLPDGEIIGKWADETLGLAHTAIIFQQNGQYAVRKVYGDGSFGDFGLARSGDFFKYEMAYDEYYKIENNGDLGRYDDMGLISTAKAIE